MEVVVVVLLGILSTVVVPIVLTKTTERARFDFIHPYLREIWTGIIGFYVLGLCWWQKSFLMEQRSNFHGPMSFLVVGLMSAAAGCFVWALTGWILHKAEPVSSTTATTSGNAESQQGAHSSVVAPAEPIAPARLTTPLIQLMFKDSPLFTLERRERISGDMNAVAAYLEKLGIPVPDDLPPIGVDTRNPKGEGWSFNSQSDNKYYYNQFTLQQGALDERSKITEAFLSFTIGRFIYTPPPPPQPNLAQMTPQQFWYATHTPEAMNPSYKWKGSVVLTQYLNHSYWSQPFAKNERPVCPDQGDGMAYYFWQMRGRFGKEFTDKLAIFTLRALVDKPYTGTNADATHPYRHYFYERLKLADSVIDNENSKMPVIDSILTACGWLPLT